MRGAGASTAPAARTGLFAGNDGGGADRDRVSVAAALTGVEHVGGHHAEQREAPRHVESDEAT